MSQQDVEFVRQTLGLLAGQDVVAFFNSINEEDLKQVIEATYTPDVEIRWLEGNPDQRAYVGRDDVPAAFSDWLDAWETFVFEPKDLIAAGDHVLVPNTQRGTGKGSGVEISMETTMIVTVRDGKIASIHEFADHSDAVEAVGLST
jgi:ketosteroid isomerase-like protein